MQPDLETRLYLQPAASLSSPALMNIQRYVFTQPCTLVVPFLPQRGVSCLLGGSFRKSRGFTFKPAAGSFAVDSADVIYFIRPLRKWFFCRHLRNVPLQRHTPVLGGSRVMTIFGLILDLRHPVNDSFAFNNPPSFLCSVKQIRDAAFSFRALHEWRPRSPGETDDLKG